MQRTLRLALAQFNPTVGDIPGNTARIIEQIDEARAAHADLVAFPELKACYPSRQRSRSSSWRMRASAARRAVRSSS